MVCFEHGRSCNGHKIYHLLTKVTTNIVKLKKITTKKLGILHNKFVVIPIAIPFVCQRH